MMEAESNWKCAEPCGEVMANKKEWNKHHREKHANDTLCSALAPFYMGYLSCDKWEGHDEKHEAMGYEWIATDLCAVCSEPKGANYEHWNTAHRKNHWTQVKTDEMQKPLL